MKTKLAVVLIHGIGGSRETWAEPIIQKLNSRVLAELKTFLKGGAPSVISEVLITRSVYWKTVFEKPQSDLQKILDAYFKTLVGGMKFFLSFVGGWLTSFYRKQNKITTFFIGDIIGYMTKEGQTGVYEKIDDALNAALSEIPAEKRVPLSFISHSLGTVINSQYIYDKTDAQRKKGMNFMHERLTVTNLFTVGSPLALFSMKFGGPDSFKQPVVMEDGSGRWLNFLEKEDPISMPLRPLNAEYERAVNADIQVSAGWLFGVVHTEYFEKSNTLDTIAKKLALDWMAVNRLKADDEMALLYRKFDESFSSNLLKRS